MTIQEKQELLNYIQEHYDKSKTADKLIELLNNEVEYTDCKSMSLGAADLETYEDQKTLRKILNKDDSSPYTPEDVQKIAKMFENEIANDFKINLRNTINNHNNRYVKH